MNQHRASGSKQTGCVNIINYEIKRSVCSDFLFCVCILSRRGGGGEKKQTNPKHIVLVWKSQFCDHRHQLLYNITITAKLFSAVVFDSE